MGSSNDSIDNGAIYPAYARIGNTKTGNFVEITNEGRMLSKGNSLSWDDEYVLPSELEPLGALSFPKKQFRNDGVSGDGTALSFDGTNQYGTVLDYDNLDVTGDFSIEMWIRPQIGSANTVLEREDYWELEINGNGRVRFRLGTLPFVSTSNNLLLIGAWNHLCITGEDIGGGDTLVNIYVDAVLQEDATRGQVLGASAENLIVGANSSLNDNYYGDIDGLILYNKALTQSQVEDRYNNGIGTVSLPTGIVEATDVIARFPFDDGEGSTVENTATLGTNDMTLTNDPEWIAGIINGSGNQGVFLPVFEPGKFQAASFNIPISHKWKVNSILKPHLHFSTKEIIPAGAKIALSLEYSWSRPGAIFPETIVDDQVYTFPVEVPAYTHVIVGFDDITSDYPSETVSPHICATLYRKGFQSEDTYLEDIYFVNFGNHYQSDEAGSREEYSKN